MNPLPAKEVDYIDICYKIAMITIAILNLCYALYVFKFKNNKEDKDKEKDRRINWLKNIILDYNLDNFYDFFKKSHEELSNLKNGNLEDLVKGEINDEIATLFINLRRDFTDSFLAVDDKIYADVMFNVDRLQDFLTNEIFNEENDFQDELIFQEIVEEPLSMAKSVILKIIFSYRG